MFGKDGSANFITAKIVGEDGSKMALSLVNFDDGRCGVLINGNDEEFYMATGKGEDLVKGILSMLSGLSDIAAAGEETVDLDDTDFEKKLLSAILLLTN